MLYKVAKFKIVSYMFIFIRNIKVIKTLHTIIDDEILIKSNKLKNL